MTASRSIKTKKFKSECYQSMFSLETSNKKYQDMRNEVFLSEISENNMKVWQLLLYHWQSYKQLKVTKFHDPFTFKNLPPVKSVALSASQILKQRTIKLCRNEFQVSYSPFTLSRNHRPSTVSLRSLLSCAFLSGWYQLGLCL